MRTIAQDKAASRRTHELRAKHGGSRDTCPTCCRPVGDPFRRVGPDGKLVSGCVDAAHEGHIAAVSSSGEWHYRPEARAIRQRMEVGP